ncbi:cytochrome b6-f complex subunit 6 [Oscillatoriales cyanobacterium USR001]|nr:cytochrome b6-f complex subunit 6 [Oscillatoriales cyanobacterium USR001]
MTLDGAIAYFVILGGMWALATGLMFGLRAVKLI